MGKGL